MASNERSAAQKLVAATIDQLSNDERAEVLLWAQRSLTVVEDNNLSRTQKVVELQKIKPSKAVLRIFLAVARLLKIKAWDNQSWARRLGLSGLVAGAVTFGTQGAGLAAMGTAVGIPLALITGAGTALLGLIIDEIQKERRP